MLLKSSLNHSMNDYENEINRLNNMLEKSSRIIKEYVETKVKEPENDDSMTLTDLNPI